GVLDGHGGTHPQSAGTIPLDPPAMENASPQRMRRIITAIYSPQLSGRKVVGNERLDVAAVGGAAGIEVRAGYVTRIRVDAQQDLYEERNVGGVSLAVAVDVRRSQRADGQDGVVTHETIVDQDAVRSGVGRTDGRNRERRAVGRSADGHAVFPPDVSRRRDP